MARLDVVTWPSQILKRRSADVTELDGATVQLARDMAETMYLSNGIGLAAPQVARNVRVVTIDVARSEGGASLLHLVNPLIVEGHGWTTYEEGCLSFPGISAEVKRRDQIHLKAYGLDGREIDMDADGLLAICIQHELDHLNGVVFLDRLSPMKRKFVEREYLRIREEEREEDVAAAIEAAHAEQG
jgi:peptide deformylase